MHVGARGHVRVLRGWGGLRGVRRADLQDIEVSKFNHLTFWSFRFAGRVCQNLPWISGIRNANPNLHPTRMKALPSATKALHGQEARRHCCEWRKFESAA